MLGDEVVGDMLGPLVTPNYWPMMIALAVGYVIHWEPHSAGTTSGSVGVAKS